MTDIDECRETPEICGAGNQCRNNRGRYTCECSDAYILSEDRKSCIGWCSFEPYFKHTRSLSIKALMTHVIHILKRPWTLRLDIRQLFTLVNNPLFSDIDECVSDPDICINGKCQNLLGSFRCECSKGFMLAEGSMACVGKALDKKKYTTLHNTMEDKVIPHRSTLRNSKHHNTSQHNTTQHYAIQRQPSKAKHSTAHRNTTTQQNARHYITMTKPIHP